MEVGDYTEYFGLVTSDGRWFSESGGPEDGAIRLEIEVREGGASAPDPDAVDGQSRIDGSGCNCGNAPVEGMLVSCLSLLLPGRRRA